MKPLLLSICIPTYNRSSFLEKGLKKFVDEVQRNRMQKSIEILIGDNKSTDNTVYVLNSFRKKYSFVHYFTNKKNLGFSGNMLNLLKRAKGEYIWFLSDDDFIYRDSLREIAKNLKKYNPLLTYLNYDVQLLDSNQLIRNFLHLKRSFFFRKRKQFFRFFRSLRTIYQLRSSYFSFISMMVIKKEIFLKNLPRVKRVINTKKTLFPHTWLLWIDFPSQNILLLKRPLFEQSFSHKSHSTMVNSWFHSCLNFITHLNPVYVHIVRSYGKEGGLLFTCLLIGGIIYSYAALALSSLFFLSSKIPRKPSKVISAF